MVEGGCSKGGQRQGHDGERIGAQDVAQLVGRSERMAGHKVDHEGFQRM